MIPTSVSSLQNHEHVWFPVTSRRTGQTVLLGCPRTMGTPADAIAEFPEFVPYYPIMEASITAHSHLICYGHNQTVTTTVFQMNNIVNPEDPQELKKKELYSKMRIIDIFSPRDTW